MSRAVALDRDRYLSRVELSPADVTDADREALQRLQAAHVTSVPFETLAITGDPFGDRDGDGVTLSVPDLYEKVVERERGGFCYELNGLFGWLLADLGFDADRVAAMVLGDDGDPRPPANHLAHVVSLDRRYVVDVGTGTPQIHRPLPLDGEVVVDAAGVEWRVADSDRPDADYLTRYREPGDDDWTDRYVFRDEPRDLPFFEATCEFLQSAPESPFTGDPVVAVATDDGYAKLTPETLTRTRRSETHEHAVDPERWHDVLEREFGLRYPSE